MPQHQDMSPTHPYADLPLRAYWRSAVGTDDPVRMTGLWQPKFLIAPEHPVATYGSCFAQHIGRALRRRGYDWLVTEKPPRRVSGEVARRHGYRLFSARTGNIYTPTLLLQWLRWAVGEATPPDDAWPEGTLLRDPFRPRIEPEGFESLAEVKRLRRVTLRALSRSVRKARVFVFTLGLTERWIDLVSGQEYPLCPGTAAGRFDPERHVFDPLDYPQALEAMQQALELMHAANPRLRFVLTVSPVPLAATASGAHVLCATSGSKAILRAVAGTLAQTRADTDYFPSYEMITSPVFGGRFFASDCRQVTDQGVGFVMDRFFGDMATQFGLSPAAERAPLSSDPADPEEPVCEEQLLAAFGPGA